MSSQRAEFPRTASEQIWRNVVSNQLWKGWKNKSKLSFKPILNSSHDDGHWGDLARPFWHNIKLPDLNYISPRVCVQKGVKRQLHSVRDMADDCGMLRIYLEKAVGFMQMQLMASAKPEGSAYHRWQPLHGVGIKTCWIEMLDYTQNDNSVLTCLNILHRQTWTSMRCWCQGYSKKMPGARWVAAVIVLFLFDIAGALNASNGISVE